MREIPRLRTRKYLLLILLLLYRTPIPLFAETGTHLEVQSSQIVTTEEDPEAEDLLPVPYDESEFPAFALQLRRAETIFFGSLPISYAAASLADTLLQQSSGPPDQAAYSRRIVYSLSISLAITLIDLLIDLQVNR